MSMVKRMIEEQEQKNEEQSLWSEYRKKYNDYEDQFVFFSRLLCGKEPADLTWYERRDVHEFCQEVNGEN